jgi:hypothetical protein
MIHTVQIHLNSLINIKSKKTIVFHFISLIS